MQTSSRSITVAVASIYVASLAVWAGGLGILGAVVAPIVFRVVAAPASADAMTLVFRRYDAIAMTCAAIAFVAEATLGFLAHRPSEGEGTSEPEAERPRRRIAPSDVVRSGALGVAGALAIAVGAWLSPGIEGLHRGGAVRGFGADGLELERLHRLAELAGKGQIALLLVVLVLLLGRVTRAS